MTDVRVFENYLREQSEKEYRGQLGKSYTCLACDHDSHHCKDRIATHSQWMYIIAFLISPLQNCNKVGYNN